MFAAPLREALGREPERPAELRDLERLPQRFTLIERDADAVKRYIAVRS
jgi:threonine synthase